MVSHHPGEESESEYDEPFPAKFPARKTSHSPVVPNATESTRPRRNRRSESNDTASVSSSQSGTKDRFQSFHDAIIESMEETQRMRRSRLELDGDTSNASVLMDTVKDIKNAASGTMLSIKKWANKNNEQVERNPLPPSSQTPLMPATNECLPLTACCTPHSEPNVETIDHFLGKSQGQDVQKNSLIQDLAWPFVICGVNMSESLPDQNEFAPHMKKMKDAVAKVVNGDMNAANDIWKFAAISRDDDDNTIGTLDTLQEENNQIRRLGSWGTVGTAGTNGTCDTGCQSIELMKTPMDIRVGVEDDDGNAIDPVLLEKAQQTREKRQPRRQKLVQFDYPPIKSLRQCPRPNPEDLPALYFTEGELDQIEDDRYSTMSTDDIEIVVVADKTETETKGSKFKNRKSSPKSRRGAGPTFADSPVDAKHSPSPSTGREPPEIGRKPVKARTSTPHRRRQIDDDDEPDFSPSEETKSPNNRLVKGVQIYLRERSTGL